MHKKIFAALIALLFLNITSQAQKAIQPDEAAKHVGDTVLVCGKIFGCKFFDKSDNKITLLNMGAAYPNAPLTIVIPANNRQNFTEAPEQVYLNKEVCIKGVITAYKGKPQITIAKPQDVEVK